MEIRKKSLKVWISDLKYVLIVLASNTDTDRSWSAVWKRSFSYLEDKKNKKLDWDVA